MEREKSNGCTVHFNSILQLLIYKPQSINKTLIKLEISKEASFFFFLFFFLQFCISHFSFTFEHYKGFPFFSLSLLFKLLLDHTSTSFVFLFFFTLEVSSIISLPGCFEIKKKRRKEMRQEEEEVGKIKNKNNNSIFRIHTIHSISDFKNPDCTLEYIIYHHY